jgi:putative transposase
MHTQDGHSVKQLCQTLEVSCSGFYAHQHKAAGARRKADARLSQQIGLLFVQSRFTYGCRRIQRLLRQEGFHCAKTRICRLMKAQGLRARQKRRFRIQTTNSNHQLAVAPNRLAQLPQPPSQPNEVWAADITYLPTRQQGWLYLAVEMDLCSRRIVGWKLDSSLAAPLVVDAFQRALKGWAVAPRVHHSDRGIQYATASFRQLLQAHQVQPSMSRKANCYDNAAIESFFATLKTECFQHGIPKDRLEAQAMLFDYIETFYNPKRLHSALGYLSPLQFEKSFIDQPFNTN